MDPKQRRLAVQVEDHPIDYGDFEGVIPSGYGAGTVLLWDMGERTWVEGPKGQVTEGLRDGHLDFELNGQKLKGGFSLIRMDHGASGKKDEWLLIKKADAAADPDLIFPDTSVKTDRGLDQVAADGLDDQAPQQRGLEALIKEAPKGKLPATLTPMLATLVDRPFSSPDWLFELKYDGVRAVVRRTGGKLSVQGRSGRDETARYPELQNLVGFLDADDCLIDGEIVALDPDGHPSFERLQHRMQLRPAEAERASQEQPVVFMAFDLLFAQGRDLMRMPLELRKRALRAAIRDGGVVRYADHVEEEGETFYAKVREAGLEGVVAKRSGSSYQPGRRSRDWLKLKVRPTQDCIICGYVPGKGRRARLGALVLGVYAEGQLVDAGRVGTGFTEELLLDLEKKLVARRRQTPPFKAITARDRDVVWTRPDLVCEVEHAGWTTAQKLRQPSFRSLRPDVPPKSCIREPPVLKDQEVRRIASAAALKVRSTQARATAPHAEPEIEAALDQLAQMPGAGGVLEVGPRQVKVSHLDKLMWPKDRISKRDLIAYHLRISRFLLPHLRDRAVVLQVFPDGIDGKSFWRRSLPESAPSWIPTWEATPGTPTICPLFQEPAALAWAANQGAIDIHPWHSRRDRPTQPDWAVFDLDPSPGATFAEVLEVAHMVKAGLDHLKLRSVVKTTGQKGLHIYVPIRRRPPEAEVRDWVGEFAHHLVEAAPSLLTESWAVKGRQSKIRVDYTQNVIGKTLAAVYSPRPFPGGRVSTPLEWEELEGLDPAEFTLSRVVERAEAVGDLFAAALEGRQTLPPLGNVGRSEQPRASTKKRR